MAAPPETPGLTDTDILIDATRGVPGAIAFLESLRRADGINISVVSAMEMVVGCGNGLELAELNRFLQHVAILPMTPASSQLAHQWMTA
jgi:predicted nucleic acid-binding protein